MEGIILKLRVLTFYAKESIQKGILLSILTRDIHT